MAKRTKKNKSKKTTPPPFQFYGDEVLLGQGVTNMLPEVAVTDDAPRNNTQLGYFSRMYPESQYGNVSKYAGFIDNLGATARTGGEIGAGMAPGVGEAIDAAYVADALSRGDKEEAAFYAAMGVLPIASAPLFKTIKGAYKGVKGALGSDIAAARKRLKNLDNYKGDIVDGGHRNIMNYAADRNLSMDSAMNEQVVRKMMDDIAITGGLKKNPQLRTQVRNFISAAGERQGRKQLADLTGVPDDFGKSSGYNILTGKEIYKNPAGRPNKYLLGQAGTMSALQKQYPNLDIQGIAKGDAAPFNFVQNTGRLSNVYNNKLTTLANGRKVPVSKKDAAQRINYSLDLMKKYSDPNNLTSGLESFSKNSNVPMSERAALRNNLNAFGLSHSPSDVSRFYRGKNVNNILNTPATDANSILRIAERGPRNASEKKALDLYNNYISTNKQSKFSLPNFEMPNMPNMPKLNLPNVDLKRVVNNNNVLRGLHRGMVNVKNDINDPLQKIYQSEKGRLGDYLPQNLRSGYARRLESGADDLQKSYKNPIPSFNVFRNNPIAGERELRNQIGKTIDAAKNQPGNALGIPSMSLDSYGHYLAKSKNFSEFKDFTPIFPSQNKADYRKLSNINSGMLTSTMGPTQTLSTMGVNSRAKATTEYLTNLKKSGSLNDIQTRQVDEFLKTYKGSGKQMYEFGNPSPFIDNYSQLSGAGQLREIAKSNSGEIRGGIDLRNFFEQLDPAKIPGGFSDFGSKMHPTQGEDILKAINEIELKNINKKISNYNHFARNSKGMEEIPLARLDGDSWMSQIIVNTPKMRAAPTNPKAPNFPQYQQAIKKGAEQFKNRAIGLYGAGVPLATYGSYKLGKNFADNYANSLDENAQQNETAPIDTPNADAFSPMDSTQYQQFSRYEDSLFNPNFNKDTMINYAKGGFFKKVGQGIRDLGVAAVNTGAAPLEALMGTDFGIDEKFGYKTKFGKTVGDIGETVGSAVGSFAPTALNVVAPGLGTAVQMGGQAIGSGLESAGVTKDISTDPQSAMGSQIGQLGSMFAGANPAGGFGDLANNMANTNMMQNFSGIFLGNQTPPAQKGMKNYKYKEGGISEQADIEAESGEIVLTQGGQPRSLNSKAGLNNLGEGAYEIKGDESHSKGGADLVLPEGESTIITNLKGRSTKVKALYAKISKANEKIKSTDFIERQQGELEKRNAMAQVQQEVAEQQKDNGNQTNVDTDMAKRGLWANIHDKRERIKRGSKERMRKPGSKGAPTKEALKNSQAMYGMQYMKAENGMQFTNLPEGISSSMYGLGFNPQSMPGMEPGAYSNMDRSMSSPIRGVQGQYEGRKTTPPRAQEGVVNYNMPATGPYSNPMGQMYSGNQDLGGGSFDRQIGFMNDQGVQNMYPEYQNQVGAMYGMSRPKQNPINLSQAGMPNIAVPNTPQSFREYSNSVPMQNFGVGDGMSTSRYNPNGDNEINLSQLGRPTEYPTTLDSIGLQSIPIPEQNLQLRRQEGSPPPRTYPTPPRDGFDFKSMMPYASSMYNVGAGIAGLINPAEGMKASDYQLDGRMRANKIDPYSQISPSLQIAATAIGSERDPVRRQAMASSMAPNVAQQFSRTSYLNNQLENEAQRYNLGIDKYNKGVQGQVDKFNMGLEAMPYQMIQQGLGQAANTSIAMDRNNMLRDLSQTARFDEGNFNFNYGYGNTRPGQIRNR